MNQRNLDWFTNRQVGWYCKIDYLTKDRQISLQQLLKMQLAHAKPTLN